jgi:hypothetical protein
MSRPKSITYMLAWAYQPEGYFEQNMLFEAEDLIDAWLRAHELMRQYMILDGRILLLTSEDRLGSPRPLEDDWMPEL